MSDSLWPHGLQHARAPSIIPKYISLYIWILTPIRYMVCKYSSHSLYCFSFCWSFLLFCRIFSVWYSTTCLFIFYFVSYALVVILKKKSLQRPIVTSFFPMFSFRGYMVFSLTFKSLIHFELILVSALRWESSFIFLLMNIQFF